MFFFSSTFPIVFLSGAGTEQSLLYRKAPPRSDRDAAHRSPSSLTTVSFGASHTRFNLKSRPEVPGALKASPLWLVSSSPPPCPSLRGSFPCPPLLSLRGFISPRFHPTAGFALSSLTSYEERNKK